MVSFLWKSQVGDQVEFLFLLWQLLIEYLWISLPEDFFFLFFSLLLLDHSPHYRQSVLSPSVWGQVFDVFLIFDYFLPGFLVGDLRREGKNLIDGVWVRGWYVGRGVVSCCGRGWTQVVCSAGWSRSAPWGSYWQIKGHFGKYFFRALANWRGTFNDVEALEVEGELSALGNEFKEPFEVNWFGLVGDHKYVEGVGKGPALKGEDVLDFDGQLLHDW